MCLSEQNIFLNSSDDTTNIMPKRLPDYHFLVSINVFIFLTWPGYKQ